LPPADWTSSFIYWDLDEASGTRVNSGGVCGTDCDLSDNNTVTQDTTNEVEGTAGASFASANNEYLSCTHATCGASNELGFASSGGTGGDLTIFAWVRPTADADMSIMTKFNADGYRMRRVATNDLFSCTIDGTSTASLTAGNNTLPINETHHVACRFNDTANTLDVFVDGAEDTTNADPTPADINVETGRQFEISENSVSQVNGMIDGAGAINDVLTDQELCRICSIHVDGSLGLCDQSTPANYKACSTDADCRPTGNTTAVCDTTNGTCSGRNATGTPNCGGCTLPACNAAAP